MPLDAVEFKGRVIHKDNAEQMVFGWAYVSHDKNGKQVVDKSGEFIPNPLTLEKAAYKFVLESRRGRDFHGLGVADDLSDTDSDLTFDFQKGSQVATMIESMVFTPEKCKRMGIPAGLIPASGWWTGWKIHHPQLWKAHMEGRRSMFSIHGYASGIEV